MQNHCFCMISILATPSILINRLNVGLFLSSIIVFLAGNYFFMYGGNSMHLNSPTSPLLFWIPLWA